MRQTEVFQSSAYLSPNDSKRCIEPSLNVGIDDATIKSQEKLMNEILKHVESDSKDPDNTESKA